MQSAASGAPPDFTLLSSFESVIAELGGITAVSRLTGRSRTAVCNWRSAGLFPAAQYPKIQDALAELELTASRRLFTFEEPEPPPIRDRAVCA
jgi:hypothetical protein